MAQTVCANCGSAQGPFSRKTGSPLCAGPRAFQLSTDVVKNCNARRRARDSQENNRPLDTPKEDR